MHFYTAVQIYKPILYSLEWVYVAVESHCSHYKMKRKYIYTYVYTYLYLYYNLVCTNLKTVNSSVLSS